VTLTKAQIAESIQNELGLQANHSQKVVETLLEIMKATLESGEYILVSGFGKFCIKEKTARKGRNPATGDDMILKARRVVTFRCSSKLRSMINDMT